MEQTQVKKLAIATVGCRLNQYESEKMALQLSPFGFVRAEPGERADLYIINTCTVTHRADSDCRNLIRRAARSNPHGRIVVTGCYVDSDPRRIEGMEGVDVIVKNSEKDDVAKILPKRLPDLFTSEPDKNCSYYLTDFHEHNRAWLKVSDGCNQWCSFCIIPRVRGRLKNRPPLEIIDEVRALVSHGYNEVVLTGVHTGHYKNRKSEPQVKNLAHLCRMILEHTDIRRIRISSIEPQTVRNDMISTFRESGGRICRHFHIPLQSGSSRILKAMRRPYDQKTYIARAESIKAAVPNTVIGADVIVGFPGETGEDFKRTKSLCESGLIDYLHVFSYSDRADTHASSMPDKVNPELIKERSAILTQVSSEIRAKSFQRQIGQTLDVISERKEGHDGHHAGISDNYMRVRLPATINSGKEIVKVKVTNALSDCVEGILV